MKKPEVSIGAWISGGFSLFRDNFITLLVTGIFVMVISWISVGILFGPMLAGLLLVTVALAKKEQPAPGVFDSFQGFRYFMDAFPFVLFWGASVLVVAFLISLIPLIGPVMAALLVLSVKALLMLGLFLIVDKDMEFYDASMLSIETVKPKLGSFLLLALVIVVLNWLGSIAFCVGLFITLPLSACMATVAYMDFFGDPKQLEILPAAEESAVQEPTAAVEQEAAPVEEPEPAPAEEQAAEDAEPAGEAEKKEE